MQSRNCRQLTCSVTAASTALAKTAPIRPPSRGALDKHGMRALGKFGVMASDPQHEAGDNRANATTAILNIAIASDTVARRNVCLAEAQSSSHRRI